mmetsp:Transcript_44168/g.122431  ORF Transcript_44168/g.122431 Transcript_44168/m.122431 type:complete len:254 (+) Transcript_44168:447-1208(+)
MPGASCARLPPEAEEPRAHVGATHTTMGRAAVRGAPARSYLAGRLDNLAFGYRVRREGRIGANLPPVGGHLFVPLDGAPQAFFQADLRLPAECHQLLGGDVVSHVVEGAVGHKDDMVLGLRAGHYRKDELLCDLKVGALLLAADVVRVAVDAFVQDRDEGVRHVLDVDEVARVGPVPVEAARLALHKPPDELGHNLLRVLVRAVDVVAACDDHRHLVRVEVRLDDVLRRGLGRRVRVGRLEHVRLDMPLLAVV